MAEYVDKLPKKHGPLVSVLIPAYNHERYVQAAIDSVAAQSWQNLELIIIDDGSQDGTWLKIEEAKDETQGRFVRFDISRQENTGIGATVNRLFEKSAGEYVFLIASDDIAAGNAIETMLSFLETHNDYALCVGDNGIIDDSGTICFWDRNRVNVYDRKYAAFVSFMDFIAKTNANPNLLSGGFGGYEDLLLRGNHVPNGYLIRKSVLEKTGPLPKEALLEDYYLMLQISKYAKMQFLPQTLFYYRWHDNNTIKGNRMAEYNFQTILHELRNTCPFFLDVYIRELLDFEKKQFHKLMPGIYTRKNSRTHRLVRKFAFLRHFFGGGNPNA